MTYYRQHIYALMTQLSDALKRKDTNEIIKLTEDLEYYKLKLNQTKE